IVGDTDLFELAGRRAPGEAVGGRYGGGCCCRTLKCADERLRRGGLHRPRGGRSPLAPGGGQWRRGGRVAIPRVALRAVRGLRRSGRSRGEQVGGCAAVLLIARDGRGGRRFEGSHWLSYQVGGRLRRGGGQVSEVGDAEDGHQGNGR